MSLLTEKQAASFAGVDRKTIRRLIEAGRLPAADYGTGKKKLYRINPDDLLSIKRGIPAPDVRLRPHRQAANVAAAYLPWASAKASPSPSKRHASRGED